MGASTQPVGAAEPPHLDGRQLQLYRSATLASGLFYLAWWVAVELLLPRSFNPLGSRVAVVLFCLLVFAGSFFSRAIAERMSFWFLACTWAVSLHYFYLFGRNASDINWIVGTYILVIAVSACTTSLRQLVGYAAFVLVLSAFLIYAHPALLHTIFLSGVVTILVFAYIGLRARLRLVTRSSEAAARVQSLFDAVFEGIVVHDRGIILDVNESYARMFGYSRRELLGKDIAVLTADESRELVAKHIRSDAPARYEATGLHRDGSTIPLEVAGKGHLLDGRAVRLTAVRDLTERKRAERNRILYEAAEESLKIRDEFMLIISHELKTPITNLKLQTQLALRDFGRSGLAAGQPEKTQPDKMRSYLEQTSRQVNRLAVLVEDVVDVSQIGIGELRTTRRRIDLAELTRTVVASLAVSLHDAGCELGIEAASPVFVQADPSRIEQVLVNLLTNVLKYAPGRPVTVSVETKDEEVILAVQDHGKGIPKDDQDRIFQRFERAVSARHISGLGLGLFICKYIVEAHGGRIEVASEPGQGARFSVILPRAAEEASDAA